MKAKLTNPYARTMKKKLRSDVAKYTAKIINIQSVEWAPLARPWKQLEIEYYQLLRDIARDGLKQLKGK